MCVCVCVCVCACVRACVRACMYVSHSCVVPSFDSMNHSVVVIFHSVIYHVVLFTSMYIVKTM